MEININFIVSNSVIISYQPVPYYKKINKNISNKLFYNLYNLHSLFHMEMHIKAAPTPHSHSRGPKDALSPRISWACQPWLRLFTLTRLGEVTYPWPLTRSLWPTSGEQSIRTPLYLLPSIRTHFIKTFDWPPSARLVIKR